MSYEKFGMDRYSPDGEWVQTTIAIPIAGVHYRLDSANAFVNAVRKAENAGERYGLRLVREPNNAYDKNAIAVFGWAPVRTWFGFGTSSEKTWQIGYVPAETASSLVRDLLNKNIPIEVELYSIYIGPNGYIDIQMIILAPHGHGLKARSKSHE